MLEFGASGFIGLIFYSRQRFRFKELASNTGLEIDNLDRAHGNSERASMLLIHDFGTIESAHDEINLSL